MPASYVHGYGRREAKRLSDQSAALEGLVHDGLAFAPGDVVLEVGCGTGAQTLALARRHPGIRLVSVDVSPSSLVDAQERLTKADLDTVEFREARAECLPFKEGSIDHVFFCFVLEHLANPAACLAEAHRVLRPGGSIVAVEGDHGSTLMHPRSAQAERAVEGLVELQSRAGGDALIGRRLEDLLSSAGFAVERLEALQVVARGGSELSRSFTLDTFTAMIEGAGKGILDAGLISPDDFERGVSDLRALARSPNLLCYSFFRAIGEKIQ